MAKSLTKLVGTPHNVSTGAGGPTGESRGKANIKGCPGYDKRMGYGVNGVSGPNPGSTTRYSKKGK